MPFGVQDIHAMVTSFVVFHVNDVVARYTTMRNNADDIEVRRSVYVLSITITTSVLLSCMNLLRKCLHMLVRL